MTKFRYMLELTVKNQVLEAFCSLRKNLAPQGGRPHSAPGRSAARGARFNQQEIAPARSSETTREKTCMEKTQREAKPI